MEASPSNRNGEAAVNESANGAKNAFGAEIAGDGPVPRTALEAGKKCGRAEGKTSSDAGARSRAVETARGQGVSKGLDGIERGVLCTDASTGEGFENSKTPASAACEPMEAAGQAAVSVEMADDMGASSMERAERFVATTGRVAAWVAMTGGFRGWSDFDIVELFAHLLAARVFHFGLAGQATRCAHSTATRRGGCASACRPNWKGSRFND